MSVDAQTIAAWEKEYQRKKIENPASLAHDARVARHYCKCGGQCWCCFVWRRAQEDERSRDEH